MSAVEGELSSFNGIWTAVTFWHTLSLGFLYFIGGLIAAFVFRRRTRVALGVLMLSTFFGLLAGAIEGALYAVVIAFIYRSGPFRMEWFMAIVWGAGIAVFYLVLSIGRTWMTQLQ